MARMGFGIHPEEDDPPTGVIELADRIESDGGRALALYRDPVGDHWQIFAMLPREKVQPTPYQRDLSKTHAERLLKVIKKLDRFIDPVVAVRADGVYWTPNGNHRRHALEKLKAKFVPAIVIPESDVAFQILALNTEKAHNLKEKSLEVIRMYRGLLEGGSTKEEESYAFQFEEPYYITLGLLYEKNARFAGGAYSPILRRVDKFLKARLKPAYATREERAGRHQAGIRTRSCSTARVRCMLSTCLRECFHFFYSKVKLWFLERFAPFSSILSGNSSECEYFW